MGNKPVKKERKDRKDSQKNLEGVKMEKVKKTKNIKIILQKILLVSTLFIIANLLSGCGLDMVKSFPSL